MKGFSDTIRKDWTGPNKVLAPDEQRLTGLYVGEVMDDHDPEKLGRVWVYIPGVSARRDDQDSYSAATTATGGKFSPEKLGWIRVSPTLPFGGNDGARIPVSVDGRSGIAGTVNSYGQWSQVRKGDYVAIMFVNGDPNSGYMIGTVPHPIPSRTMPGYRGESAERVTEDTTGLASRVNSKAALPVNDQKKDVQGQEEGKVTTSSEITRNIIQAGVAADPHRGIGTSSADRESPSYVTGIKTPGWNYESEKDNLDRDGRPFRERQAELSITNTAGHSFVMDDHPDFQSVRIRSASGAQIFINDACTNPYIYIQSQTGNAWIEISDSGDVSIYAAGSLNLHAEEDFNLKVDGDFNCEIDGDYNLKIGGTSKTHCLGNTQTYTEGSLWTFADADAIFMSGEDFNISAGDDFNTRIAGNRSTTISGYDNLQIASYARYSIGGAWQVKSDGEMAFRFTGNVGILSEGNYNLKFSGGVNLEAGEDIYMDAPYIKLLEPVQESPEEPPDTIPTVVVAQPQPMQLVPSAGKPTADNMLSGEIPDYIPSIVPIIPQHHPWGDRCGTNATRGTNGYVHSSPFGTQFYPEYSYSSFCDGKVEDEIREGATRKDATAPEPLIGGADDNAIPDVAMIRTPKPYETSRKGEKPKYDETTGAVRVQHVRSPEDDIDMSEQGYKMLKKWEGFNAQPIPDAGGKGYIIGYGTRLKDGLEISGGKIDHGFLKAISKPNQESRKNFFITREEADRLLREEVGEVIDWMKEQFETNAFAPNQFDSYVMFIRSVTPERLSSDPEGRKWIEAVKNGRTDEAARIMMKFSYVNGKLDCAMLYRRRKEVRNMGMDPDGFSMTSERYSLGAVDYSNVVKSNKGPAVPRDVLKAIKQAEQAYPKVPKYVMYQMAWQESGFRPDIPNLSGTSSAKGLFQFINSTARQYGLDPNAPASAPNSVWNPYASAMAAAAFMTDNIEKLEQTTGITPTKAADIYILHFLGGGGGSKFLDILHRAPNTIAAGVFPKSAKANRSVFYKRGGTPRTVKEIYDMFDRKFERMIPYVKYLDEQTV